MRSCCATGQDHTFEDMSSKTNQTMLVSYSMDSAYMLCFMAAKTALLWKMSRCAVYTPTVHGLNLPRVSAQDFDLKAAWEFESSQC